MKRRDRFQHGSGCFTCHDCGKRTRDTGDNGGSGLCGLCHYKAGCGNSLSDAGYNGTPDAWAVFAECKSERECDDLLTVELAKLQTSKEK